MNSDGDQKAEVAGGGGRYARQPKRESGEEDGEGQEDVAREVARGLLDKAVPPPVTRTKPIQCVMMRMEERFELVRKARLAVRPTRPRRPPSRTTWYANRVARLEGTAPRAPSGG